MKYQRKGFQYRFEKYWDNYHHNHDRPTIWPKMPKLRKKQFYPRDYQWYKTCPKAWNKLQHIRPVRREWKHFCYLVRELQMSEGIPYPSDKRHIYYL